MSIIRYSRTGISIRSSTSSSSLSYRKIGPCDILTNGNVFFSQFSSKTYYRKHGPAIILATGSVCFTTRSGQYHRTDGPAIIYASGDKEYHVRGDRLSADEFFLKYGVL